MRSSIDSRPRRRYLSPLTALLIAVVATAATAATKPVEPTPLSLGRPNPEGTSI